MTTLEPVPSRNLADLVAQQIREAIGDGSYAPGARLVERTLASELGVSHIPVREALARLSDEGLVERLPRRGARVAVLDDKELDELSTLRAVLEQFVVVRVQARLTPTVEREMREIVASMRKASDRGDIERLLALDQRFHERLWELADHGLLSEFVAQLRRRIIVFLGATTAALQPHELTMHAASHGTLLDAILSGDANAARQAMADHIETASGRLRRAVDGPNGVRRADL